MKKGRAGAMTHDYKRNGTTTLFAALNVLDGTVIGRNMHRHRHQEFIRFLNAVESQVPPRKAIHAIVDNYATHKHPKLQKWLARHPRWTFHFTPTSASWLNAVEGFFAKLTRRRLKRGVFRSVDELEAAIIRFVAENNDQPKPFVWTANPKRILAAVKRWKEKLESIPVARTRHAAEKIVAKLRQVDVLMAQGRQVADAVRAKGVTEVTYYRWRNEHGGLGDQVKRLKELETENTRLRRAVSGSDAGQADPGRGAKGKLSLAPPRCVDRVTTELGISERRACRTLGQHRSTQRKTPTTPDDEAALTADIIELTRHPYGPTKFAKSANSTGGDIR